MYETVVSKDAERAARRAAVQEGTVVVYNNSHGTWVASPRTEAAVRYLGSGTNWYSPTKDRNVFDRDVFEQVDSRGLTLVVGLSGEKEDEPPRKLVIHVGQFLEESIFQDEKSQPVDEAFVESRWKELSGVVTWLLAQDARALRFVPVALRTREMCEAAANRNPSVWLHVPVDYVTEDMLVKAVSGNAWRLKDIPEDMYSENVGLAAIRKDSRVFSFIPKAHRTESMWTELMHLAPHRFGEVPKHLCTRELSLVALSGAGKNLAMIPEDDRTWNMCRAALRQDVMAIESVPARYTSMVFADGVLDNALKQDGTIFLRLPEGFRTEKFALVALPTCGMALEYVRDLHRTEQMCLDAVKEDGMAIEHVPLRYRTEAMFMAAVSQNGLAVRLIKDSDVTPQVAMAAVKQTSHAWEILPQFARTEAVRTKAVLTEVAKPKHEIKSVFAELATPQTPPSPPSFDNLRIPQMLEGLVNAIKASENNLAAQGTPKDSHEISEEAADAISKSIEAHDNRPWYRKPAI